MHRTPVWLSLGAAGQAKEQRPEPVRKQFTEVQWKWLRRASSGNSTTDRNQACSCSHNCCGTLFTPHYLFLCPVAVVMTVYTHAVCAAEARQGSLTAACFHNNPCSRLKLRSQTECFFLLALNKQPPVWRGLTEGPVYIFSSLLSLVNFNEAEQMLSQ